MAQDNYVTFYNFLPNITNESVWNRLMSQLPPWFGNSQTFTDANFNNVTPVQGTTLNTVLWAFNCTQGNTSPAQKLTAPFQNYTFYGNYAQYQYILAQMRLGPFEDQFMTDVDQLDLFAQDFFGNTLPRYANENNPTYKARIYANLFSLKCTRNAIAAAIARLTGFEPIMFEPNSIFDAMFYGYDTTGAIPISHCAYGTPGSSVGGLYGDGLLPYQGYITVKLPPDQGMGTYPGLTLPPSPTQPPNGPATWPPYPIGTIGGYNVITDQDWALYGSASLVTSIIGVNEICNVINTNKVFGTQIWFSIMYV